MASYRGRKQRNPSFERPLTNVRGRAGVANVLLHGLTG